MLVLEATVRELTAISEQNSFWGAESWAFVGFDSKVDDANGLASPIDKMAFRTHYEATHTLLGRSSNYKIKESSSLLRLGKLKG